MRPVVGWQALTIDVVLNILKRKIAADRYLKPGLLLYMLTYQQITYQIRSRSELPFHLIPKLVEQRLIFPGIRSINKFSTKAVFRRGCMVEPADYRKLKLL